MGDWVPCPVGDCVGGVVVPPLVGVEVPVCPVVGEGVVIVDVGDFVGFVVTVGNVVGRVGGGVVGPAFSFFSDWRMTANTTPPARTAAMS